MRRAFALGWRKWNARFCMKEAQMKRQPANPIGILGLVFIYYFLKFAMESAASGVSMAVVEGVSSGVSGWSVTRKAMLISPVFAYLGFTVLYFASGLFGWSKHRLAKAVERTFQFHIAFFVVSIAAFFLGGEPQTIYMFEETAIGELIMTVGKWLPVLLVIFFVWRYTATKEQTRTQDSMSSAFNNTQAG